MQSVRARCFVQLPQSAKNSLHESEKKMNRIVASFGAVSLMCIGAVAVSAQGNMAAPMSGPPKVMMIDREITKFGKNDAHEKNEAMYAQAAREGKDPGNYIAMVSTTGLEEAWFLEGYESFDQIEQQQKY